MSLAFSVVASHRIHRALTGSSASSKTVLPALIVQLGKAASILRGPSPVASLGYSGVL